MTLAATRSFSLDNVQHIVLDGMSWAFYEHLLEEIGNGHTRVTFDDGSIEIMSPLPKHEQWGARIARLIELLGLELDIPVEALGSTTFRKAKRKKGLEPDECFYIRNAAAGREMEEAWDPAVYPPPDLAIEIDITRRSIPREPIYAALGVPELWRFDGARLTVRHLTPASEYTDADVSLSFPFLPMREFEQFVLRLGAEPQNNVLREFRTWVQSFPHLR